MQIIRGIKHFTPISQSVLTIGNFDGVHLGHQAIFQKLFELSKKQNVPIVAMTFHPHPLQLLRPERGLQRIFSLEDQCEQMKLQKVEVLDLEPFTAELSQLAPEEFLRDYVQAPFRPQAIVVGYDFNFGAQRLGTLDVLRQWGQRNKVEIFVISEVMSREQVISSSLIRAEIAQGNVARVRELLGRNYYYEAVVVKGDQRGRTIGFPTANLQVGELIWPGHGVYAGFASVDSQKYFAVCNIGRRPTFEKASRLSFEVHILDFAQDIYGHSVRFEFVSKIREEKKFSSVHELQEQIKTDVQEAKSRLQGALGG